MLSKKYPNHKRLRAGPRGFCLLPPKDKRLKQKHRSGLSNPDATQSSLRCFHANFSK